MNDQQSIGKRTLYAFSILSALFLIIRLLDLVQNKNISTSPALLLLIIIVFVFILSSALFYLFRRKIDFKNILALMPIALIGILVVNSTTNKVKIKEIIRYPSGKIFETYSYKDSSDRGSYTRRRFYESGKQEFGGDYFNHKREGIWRWWFENGNQKDAAIFKNGLYVLKRKHWREDGTLKCIEILEDSCFTEYCLAKVESYDENGKKYHENSIRNGMKNGFSIYYYPNGKIHKKSLFINDTMNGESVLYDTSGLIIHKCFYKDDLQNGLQTEYFSNGKVKAQGNYINGKEEGNWLFYDSLGKFEAFMVYENGKNIKTEMSKFGNTSPAIRNLTGGLLYGD